MPVHRSASPLNSSLELSAPGETQANISRVLCITELEACFIQSHNLPTLQWRRSHGRPYIPTVSCHSCLFNRHSFLCSHILLSIARPILKGTTPLIYSCLLASRDPKQFHFVLLFLFHSLFSFSFSFSFCKFQLRNTNRRC